MKVRVTVSFERDEADAADQEIPSDMTYDLPLFGGAFGGRRRRLKNERLGSNRWNEHKKNPGAQFRGSGGVARRRT
jgi:hypothetical protein